MIAAALLAAMLPAAAQHLEGRVIEHTVPNGMKLLIVVRHNAPVFSADVMYRVGGVDEHNGSTGLAHMFEHMAFKGTQVIGTRDYAREKVALDAVDAVAVPLARLMGENRPQDAPRIRQMKARLAVAQAAAEKFVKKDEFFELYNRNGGEDANADTSKDTTEYTVSLPSNRLKLWAIMEAQRLATPVLREFYSERDVVAEERRMRTDNDPNGMLYEDFIAQAFIAHPYHFPVIGWMSDIQELTRPMALAFHKIYYIPNNAVAVLVGDVNPQEAIRLVDKYFGPIPAGPPPPPVNTVEPPQRGERRTEIKFPAQPSLLIGYHKPGPPAEDDFVLDVVDALLTGGRTSRLYDSLVKKQQLAVDVGSDNGEPGARYANLFVIEATPRYPHTPAEVEAAIYREIDRLKTEPVPEHELQKVKNQLDASFIASLASNSGLAQRLAYFQTVVGTWRYLVQARATYARITPADVQRVVRTYFTADNRTVASLIPSGASEGGAHAAQP